LTAKEEAQRSQDRALQIESISFEEDLDAFTRRANWGVQVRLVVRVATEVNFQRVRPEA
jgi:hypothetical protein